MTTTLIAKSGVRTSAAADGTVTRLTQGPDPRFGMQAPLSQDVKITTPAGLVATTTTVRTVKLTTPDDLLSLATQTDTVVVNGRIFKTVYDAAGKQFTATSAAGRTALARLNA